MPSKTRSILARDFMARDLVTIAPTSDIFDGIALLLRHNITGAPVIGGDGSYLGVLSEKCCMSVLAATVRMAEAEGRAAQRAQDIMTRRLVTLDPDADAFEAIQRLLHNRISGAPVVDAGQRFLGVFSEKFSMALLIRAAYEQVPSAHVAEYMNTDMGRVVAEDTALLALARIFLDTPYRRLPVVRDGRLVGQISRRDVLRAEHHLAVPVKDRLRRLQEMSGEIRTGYHPDQELRDALPSSEVAHFMDRSARTITPDADLLTIAQIFSATPYRRLPVVEKGRAVGMVSRRDALTAASDLLAPAPRPPATALYLSAVLERGDQRPL